MSTRKKVWQYHCDFCTKHNLSASGIARHEKHCTANPNRICRMCGAMNATQKPIAELIACLGLDKKPDYGLSELRDKADDCPACILAGIRQSRIMESYQEKFPERWYENGPLDLKFNFKQEVANMWGEINQQAMQEENYGNY